MKKIGKTQVKVYDPIFHQRVVILVNYSVEDYQAWEKRMGVANPSGHNYNVGAFTTHLTAEGEPNTYIVYMPHFEWTIDDQSTLIHELIHVIVRIWEANNIQFVPPTQEFFAHSVDQLFGEIAHKLLSKSKKKKAT